MPYGAPVAHLANPLNKERPMNIDTTQTMAPRPKTGRNPPTTTRKEHPSVRRIRDACLSCPLPECNEYSRDCVVGVVVKSNGTILSRRRRQRQAERYSDRIIAYLRRSGGDTCPGIAVAINTTEDNIYIAITSMIIDQGEALTPVDMRDGCAIYQLQGDQT